MQDHKTILLFGGGGMLGCEFTDALKNGNVYHLVAPRHTEVDIAEFDHVLAVIRSCSPDIVINCAAEIRVDDIEKNPGAAMRTNAEGPQNIARALCEASRKDTTLIHISTGDVFGQDKGFPYHEDVVPQPINAYARSKLLGEQAIAQYANGIRYAIVRTSWLYSKYRPSFVDKMVLGLQNNETVSAFGDQIGNPTWAKHLAETCVAEFVNKQFDAGIYHAINTVSSENGGLCRYDFVSEIARIMNKPARRVARVSMSDIVTAPRPKRAILANTKLPALPDWHDAISEFLKTAYGVN